MDATVLLVMDVQGGVVERFDSDPGYLRRLSAVISAARAAGIPVIYAIAAFRPGHPEISSRNLRFSALATSGEFPRQAAVQTVGQWAGQHAHRTGPGSLNS